MYSKNNYLRNTIQQFEEVKLGFESLSELRHLPFKTTIFLQNNRQACNPLTEYFVWKNFLLKFQYYKLFMNVTRDTWKINLWHRIMSHRKSHSYKFQRHVDTTVGRLFCYFLFDHIIKLSTKTAFQSAKANFQLPLIHSQQNKTHGLLPFQYNWSCPHQKIWNSSKQFSEVISLVGPNTFRAVTYFLRSLQKEIWTNNIGFMVAFPLFHSAHLHITYLISTKDKALFFKWVFFLNQHILYVIIFLSRKLTADFSSCFFHQKFSINSR